MNPYILKRIVFPAWQHLKHQNSLQLLPYLEETQWLTTTDLLDLQWKRIGALLQHGYENVPYYRAVMQDAQLDPASIAQDRSLERLPLLDRSTVRQQVQRLRATNVSPDRFVPNGTGGSTGEPLQFFDDRKEAAWSDAATWRSQRWYGIDVGDRCAYLWGSNFDLSKYQGFKGRLRSRALNLLMLPAWELSERTASKFWTRLADFKPRLLIGYAGAIHEWARLLGNDRDSIPELAAIIVSAETLYEEWRSVIENCFKVPVYNRYGGRDLHFVAQECPVRKGLHINSETVLVEIVKNGRPTPPGEVGEIVITRLDNFAMPFIRYRSGDLGALAGSLCDCGRSLPLLQKIEGRIQDAIITADGRIVSGLLFAHMIKDCPDVKEFQVHQLTINRLVILIVLQSEGRFPSRRRIDRIVRQYMGENLQIIFELRESIPFAHSGKRRITISHLGNLEEQGVNATGFLPSQINAKSLL
jgi:phenylacetate-CoA ligase